MFTGGSIRGISQVEEIAMEREYEGYWLGRGEILSNKYRIEDVIDEGGMGIVYLCFDTVLQTRVSIKEYFPRRFAMRTHGERDITVYKGRSGELYEKGLQKFVNEARIQARFESMDSIIMVKDFFVENETAYIVMEHIEGENVKQYVERKGRIHPQKVLDIMFPILEALEQLHQEGLIHRDISPDNIILTEESKGVLIDFGAARFSDMQENKTMTVFFKRGYSAEEQYVEKSAKGAYTDVYGVCATMYFMLTGIRPEESVRRLIRDTVVPLSKFHDIPLEAYKKKGIMKGMAVEAKNRYASMAELCDLLYGKKRLDRRKLVLSVVFILLLTGVVYVLGNQRLGSDPSEVASSPLTPSASTGTSPSEAETVVDTDSPPLAAVTEYKMINVVGKKKAAAVKKIKKINHKKLTIEVKKVYSAKQKKGRVIRQSVKPGTILSGDKKYTIVLTISRGIRATPTPTSRAVVTAKPRASKEPEERFDGVLPW